MGAIARNDIELVEASLRGEHEAFGHLVARYQDVVCAVSYSSTGDRVLSEDVAQETFIAAWRQLDRLRNSTRLRPWLCGIARNLARTARKRRRREELVDADEYVATGADPYDAAARSDVERVVRDALAHVPEASREVLVLYYQEDQSIREIAETLGLSETAVMQRLSRGRRYLADSVTELVEHSLRGERRRRDLVASVLAAIGALAMPSHVDASPVKGSTMLKLAVTASALVAAGTTVYLWNAHHDEPSSSSVAASPSPVLRYGSGRLGLAHAPSLGPTAAPRASASRSVAQTALAFLPANADAVIGVNFAQLRQSALWQRHVAPQLTSVDAIHDFEALCGFDPLASLGSIVLGFKGLGGEGDVSGVVVIHGLDKAKWMACNDAHGVAEAEEDGSKVTIDGEVVLITDASGREHFAFTFLDDSAALIVIGPDAATKERVLGIAAGNGGLQSASTFATALQVINTDDSLWLMLADSSPLVNVINTEIAKHAPVRLGTLYVSLNVTDTLALDAGVQLGSPQTVAGLVSTIQAKMSQPEAVAAANRYFDQLDVLADGSHLIVSLAMSGEQITQLISSIAVSVAMQSAESP